MNRDIPEETMQNIKTATPVSSKTLQAGGGEGEKELQEVMRHIKEIKEFLKNNLPE